MELICGIDILSVIFFIQVSSMFELLVTFKGRVNPNAILSHDSGRCCFPADLNL